MNISKIRNDIKSIKGRMLHFKYNGARNQVEDFYGMVENTYNYVFTIRIQEKNCIKSFSYNDVITKSLQFFL